MTRSVPREPFRAARTAPFVAYTWFAVALVLMLVILGLVALIAFLVVLTEKDPVRLGLLVAVIVSLSRLLGVIIKFFTLPR